MSRTLEVLVADRQVIEGFRLLAPFGAAEIVIANEAFEGTRLEERRSHDRRHVDRILKSFDEPNMDSMVRSQIRATFLGAAAVEVPPEDDNRRGVIDRRKAPDMSGAALPETSGAAPLLR